MASAVRNLSFALALVAGSAMASPPQPAYVSTPLTNGSLAKATGPQSVSNGDLTGAITTSGSLTTTLANSGATAGTYGDSTHIVQFTITAKGLITSASAVSISFPAAVTSVTCNAGLTGGTITSTGTCALDLTHANAWTGKQDLGAAGDVTPSGTSATGIGYAGSVLNSQSGSYTIVLTDIGKTVVETSSSAQTFTIDKNANKAYAAGFLFDILNTGTGTLTVTATTPATINQEGSGVVGNITVAPHARVKLQNVGTDLWDVVTAPGCTLISEVVTSASQSSVTFSSIPASYRDLQIKIRGASTTAGTEDTGLLQFNADTGSNYYTYAAQISGASTVAAASNGNSTSIFWGYLSGSTGPTNAASGSLINIYDYRGTTFQKTLNGLNSLHNNNSAGQLYNVFPSGYWSNTAAITSVKLFLSTSNFVNNSVISLYGCN